MFSDQGGYYVFPNGLIMQWGIIKQIDTNENGGSQGPSNKIYYYPIPFPHACLSLSISDSVEKFNYFYLTNKGTGIYSYDNRGFIPFVDMYEQDSDHSIIGCHWFAIGY